MNENKNPQVDVSHNLKNLYTAEEKDKQEVYVKMKNKQRKHRCTRGTNKIKKKC